MTKTTLPQKISILITFAGFLILATSHIKSISIINFNNDSFLMTIAFIFISYLLFIWIFNLKLLVNPLSNIKKPIIFFKSLKKGDLKNIIIDIFFTHKGRLNRQLFIYALIIIAPVRNFIVNTFLQIYNIFAPEIFELVKYDFIVQALFSIIVLIASLPMLNIIFKRYHDLGKSNKWGYAFVLICIVGYFNETIRSITIILISIMYIHLICFKGQEEDNLYSETPLKLQHYKNYYSILLTFVMVVATVAIWTQILSAIDFESKKPTPSKAMNTTSHNDMRIKESLK